MKYLLSILTLSFTCINLLAQEPMAPFPVKISLDNFKDCQYPQDTTSLHETITNLDFQYGKKPYDYSRFEYIDINQDGECEVFHYFSSGVRGWPHDFLTVYDLVNSNLIKLFDGSSYFSSFAESDGKYLQINYIEFDGHKTNPIYKNTVWKFDGEKYSPSYSPDFTKGQMKSAGLKSYQNQDYSTALVYFKNVLIMPHNSEDELLASANDVAITLIKLDRSNQVEDFLKPYIFKASDQDILANSYYNLGLAKELIDDLDEAKEYFQKSNQLNQTKAAQDKIKKYER
jgi:tetratricopeptide (TPR) repeat protein